MTRPRFLARMGGFFWLLTIVTGALAMAPRFAVPANLAATVCYLLATYYVYALLKPVSPPVSLLAAAFSLLGCTFGTLALFRVGLAPNAGFVFFGLHCLLVGGLILKSTFLPPIVGALMALGGLGWLTYGTASVLSPALGRSLAPGIMAPGILGELTLTLWLLTRGVEAARWNEEARV